MFRKKIQRVCFVFISFAFVWVFQQFWFLMHFTSSFPSFFIWFLQSNVEKTSRWAPPGSACHCFDATSSRGDCWGKQVKLGEFTRAAVNPHLWGAQVEPVPASAVLNTELAHERALMAWSLGCELSTNDQQRLWNMRRQTPDMDMTWLSFTHFSSIGIGKSLQADMIITWFVLPNSNLISQQRTRTSLATSKMMSLPLNRMWHRICLTAVFGLMQRSSIPEVYMYPFVQVEARSCIYSEVDFDHIVFIYVAVLVSLIYRNTVFVQFVRTFLLRVFCIRRFLGE